VIEGVVGQALKGRRDNIVLATKAHMPMGQDSILRGNSGRWPTCEVMPIAPESASHQGIKQ
jgi:aryl-alcohol dehydrogenase-like predicted oxidoreductase